MRCHCTHAPIEDAANDDERWDEVGMLKVSLFNHQAHAAVRDACVVKVGLGAVGRRGERRVQRDSSLGVRLLEHRARLEYLWGDGRHGEHMHAGRAS